MNEQDKEATTLFHQERGGLNSGFGPGFGCGYSTWPFAKLEIFEDKLVLTTFIFFEKIEFKKSEIISIEKFKGLLYTGIIINHNNLEVFPDVIFKSFDTDRLLSKLENAGYPVKKTEKSD
jgi:hypothetical protein